MPSAAATPSPISLRWPLVRGTVCVAFRFRRRWSPDPAAFVGSTGRERTVAALICGAANNRDRARHLTGPRATQARAVMRAYALLARVHAGQIRGTDARLFDPCLSDLLTAPTA